MYLPPLQAMHDSQVFVSGDVTIHAGAAIAPGVLLQAAPGSSIVIGSGVCIGMGAVLHAYGGLLDIQEGASLGAGVLVVGCGTIGVNACVGSLCTLLNASVQAKVLVPSGSILGDRSRQFSNEALSQAQIEPQTEQSLQPLPVSPFVNLPQQPIQQAVPPSDSDLENTFDPSRVINPTAINIPLNSSAVQDEPSSASTPERTGTQPQTTVPIHGQAYVNELLSTLLPHRNGQISPSSDP